MDRYILQRANSRSAQLFKANPNVPQLQLRVIDRADEGDGCGRLVFQEQMQINQLGELNGALQRKTNECMRVYTVRHARSWSTLDISRELLDHLIASHQVFTELWRVLLTFGLKERENEYGFPIPQVRDLELAYVLRRVEPNGRCSPHLPWSIRQTGVYQKLIQKQERCQDTSSVFLLIAPSPAAESQTVQSLHGRALTSLDAAFSVHRWFVAESMAGWMDYMCWLEDQLKIMSARIMPGQILDGFGTRPIANHLENDMYELKQLEDSIMDLLVILPTKLQTMRCLAKRYQELCSRFCVPPAACACRKGIQGFEEYSAEALNYQKRAKVLQTRVQSILSLLSDLVEYEELRTLKELGAASNQESTTIKDLMTSNNRGARAMEQMAIIGLVFIPITLVENFFSTEFVKDDGGRMQVSKNAWSIAAVAVPLTLFVFAFWQLWLRYELQLQPTAIGGALRSMFRRRRAKEEDAV